MPTFKPGQGIVVVGNDKGVDWIIKTGFQTEHPAFKFSQIGTHVRCVFLVDENLIKVIMEMTHTKEGLQWLFGYHDPESGVYNEPHLVGVPRVGELAIVEMVANGINCVARNNWDLKDNYYLVQPIIPFTELEIKANSIWAAYFFSKKVPYAYGVYFSWAAQIGPEIIAKHLTGELIGFPWLGPESEIDKKGILDETADTQDCIELYERITDLTCQSGGTRDIIFKGNLDRSQPTDAAITVGMEITVDSPLQLK